MIGLRSDERPRPFDDRADALVHLADRDRLAQDLVGATIPRAPNMLDFRMPGADDDRHEGIGTFRRGADMAGKLLPVHRPHVDVAEDEVDGPVLHRRQGIPAVGGEQDIVGVAIERPEQLPKQPAHEIVVVDDEDSQS